MRAKPIRSTTLTHGSVRYRCSSFSPIHVLELHDLGAHAAVHARPPAHYYSSIDPAICLAHA
jgi:hypothetical protein